MNRTVRAAGFAVAAALTIGGAYTPAHAEEQVVYWPLVTDGAEYRRVAYPLEAGSVLALAGSEIVLEARRSEVSYWPLTRQYITEAGTGAAIDGTLEIVDASGNPVDAPLDTYTLWSPDGVGAGVTQLLRGDAARKLYGEYVAAAREAAAKEQDYQRIVAVHQAAAEAWLKLAATRRPEDMPPPPPELLVEQPKPFRAFATEPRQAPVLVLAEGDYMLRIRDGSGNVVVGSERKLVAFGPVEQAVGYVLRPEDRWTRPTVSFSPSDTIYTTGRTDIFFQPVPVVEYPARYFTRLFDPQSFEAVDPDGTLWVPLPDGGQLPAGATLAVWSGRNQQTSLSRAGYRVQQQPGIARGYTIEEFSPAGGSLQPDFQAMRLDRNMPATRVALVQDGAAAVGSARHVVTTAAQPYWLIFIPAFIPVIAGFLLRHLARGAGKRSRPARKQDSSAAAWAKHTSTAAMNAAHGRKHGIG
jgi:hypothetical protein